MGYSPQDGIQNLIEILTDVFGQEAEDPVAVLLQQSILATITPVGVGVAQMLPAIQFDDYFLTKTNKVDNVFSYRLLSSEFEFPEMFSP